MSPKKIPAHHVATERDESGETDSSTKALAVADLSAQCPHVKQCLFA
jgi:hypothetical protein